MRNLDEIRKELDAPIPRDVVAKRSQGRFDLSYLEGWYVIDRMNKIFGQGNWEYHVVSVTKVAETELNGKYFAAYTAHIGLEVRFNETQPTRISDVGYGDGYDSSNPGKPHESALKEAVTDGIKRCAKSLGMSLGLALYDKTQANVVDSDEEKAEVKEEVKVEPKKEVTKSKSKVTSKDELKAIALNLIARNKLSREDFKNKYLDLVKADKVDSIANEAQVLEVLNKLKTNYKGDLG